MDLFDTANIYGDGRAEQILGANIGSRSDVLLVSKCGYRTERGTNQDFGSAALRASAEGSLRRLRRSHLDVLLLHSPPSEVLGHGEAYETLDQLRVEGAAIETGVSLRSIDDWELATKWSGCKVVELIFNLLDQRPIDRGILADADRRGISIIARVPLCFGLLAGSHHEGERFPDGDQRARWSREQLDRWVRAADEFTFLQRPGRTLAQAALAWAISQPGVVAAIPGMKTVNQVRENIAARDVQLSVAELRRARDLWPEVADAVPG